MSVTSHSVGGGGSGVGGGGGGGPKVTPTCFVYYHIPGDQDDADHPNAFPIFKHAADVRLKDVKHRFPLPGQYHFRFKLKHDGSFVWVDVTNDDSSLPSFKNQLIAKVLRVSWSSDRKHDRRATASSSKCGDETPHSSQVTMNLIGTSRGGSLSEVPGGRSGGEAHHDLTGRTDGHVKSPMNLDPKSHNDELLFFDPPAPPQPAASSAPTMSAPQHSVSEVGGRSGHQGSGLPMRSATHKPSAGGGTGSNVLPSGSKDSHTGGGNLDMLFS
eukprot:Selendium_serpulae@DN5336_c0_g1_i1.p1